MGRTIPQPVDLSDPNLPRLIIRLALPAIVGLSANAFYHTVNTLFLGRLGPEAISAVSTAFPIIILLAAVGEGIGVGTASFVSRMLGAKRPDTANRAATVGMGFVILFGMGLSLTLAPHLEEILKTFGATETALPQAHSYMQIFILGYTPMMMQIFGDLIAIAEGNTRFSMWTLVGSFGLMVILDPIFIFVFDLGVAGAAAATFVAQITAVCAYFVYFSREFAQVRISFRFFAPSREILREIAMVGLPATFASSLTALAFALVYRTTGSYGDTAVASIGIVLRLISLGALPVYGFCLGARSVLGFAWGAADFARLLSALRFMLMLTACFCTAFALLILTGAPLILKLFTGNAEVLAIGVKACFACFLFFPLFGLHVVLLTFLQAAGKARLAMLVLLAPQGYFLIPGLMILPGIWGLPGLLASQTIAAGLTALLSVTLIIWQLGELRRRAHSSFATAMPSAG